MKHQNLRIMYSFLCFLLCMSFISCEHKTEQSQTTENNSSEIGFMQSVIESTPEIQKVFSESSKEIADGLLIREIAFQTHFWRQQMFVAEVDMTKGWKLGVMNPGDTDSLPYPEPQPLHLMAASANNGSRTVELGVNGDIFGYYHGSPYQIPAGVWIKNGNLLKGEFEPSCKCFIYSRNDGSIAIANHDEYVQDKDEIRDAIGGWHLLVWDGKLVEQEKGNIYVNDHPRTFIGISKDRKKLFLFVIDGRQTSYSHGIDLDIAANICIGAKCDRACNLDGGGSTAMVIRDREQAGNVFKYLNKPCDKMPDGSFGPRELRNGLMIYAD